jgi:hypothetical protein
MHFVSRELGSRETGSNYCFSVFAYSHSKDGILSLKKKKKLECSHALGIDLKDR